MSVFGAATKSSEITADALGVWIAPGIGLAYPELKTQLAALHNERVTLFNFLPSGWAAAVANLQKAHPNDLVRLSPGLAANGDIIRSNPDWLTQNGEVASAWHKAFMSETKAITDYARKQQEAGKAELDRLYREAAFWNKAYTLGKVTGVVQAQAAVSGTVDWFTDFYRDNQNTIKFVATVVGVLGALWVLAPYFKAK